MGLRSRRRRVSTLPYADYAPNPLRLREEPAKICAISEPGATAVEPVAAVSVKGRPTVKLVVACFRRPATLAGNSLAQKRRTSDHPRQNRQAEGRLAYPAPFLRFPAAGIGSKPESQYGADATLHSGDDVGNIRSNG